MNSCEIWLKQYLKGTHGVRCEEVRIMAKQAGFTKGELKAARKELGVKTQSTFDRGEPTGDHYWYLPNERPDNHDA